MEINVDNIEMETNIRVVFPVAIITDKKDLLLNYCWYVSKYHVELENTG